MGSLSNTDVCIKCNPGCSKCSLENGCIECFDENAVIRDKNCYCKTGYSWEHSFINNQDCIKCPENCLKCTNSRYCGHCNFANNNDSDECSCSDDNSLSSSNGSCMDCFEFCFNCLHHPDSSKCLDNHESQKNICKCQSWCSNSEYIFFII